MKRFVLVAVLLLFGSVTFAQDDTQADVVTFRTEAPDASAIELEEVITDLIRPLYVTHAGDERLFIVEQRGRIYVRQADGELSIFLDIVSRVSPEANSQQYTERGMLGLAFAPDYSESGTFYVNYTNPRGTTHVSRFQVSDNPNEADASSEEVIFTQDQPFPNHNGGHMAFGADGFLYVSLGDGGAANDPLQAGQNPQTLLGTILRLDVAVDEGYIVPEDNPFVTGADGAPEVWAYGLRNVWRFSFDRTTGDMYFGDVGQNQWEEINFEPADSAGGLNYGWNAFEATKPFGNGIVPSSEVVMPIAEYNHSLGCSVTGGYIYRGEAIPDLVGAYLYSDYCTGNVWYAYRDDSGAWQSDLFLETGMQVSSFGEDVNGELYIVNYRGSVHQIVPAQ